MFYILEDKSKKLLIYFLCFCYIGNHTELNLNTHMEEGLCFFVSIIYSMVVARKGVRVWKKLLGILKHNWKCWRRELVPILGWYVIPISVILSSCYALFYRLVSEVEAWSFTFISYIHIWCKGFPSSYACQ